MNLQHARQIAYGKHHELKQNGLSCEEENTFVSNEKHTVPCEQCNMPHGSCIAPPDHNLHNLRGVMVGRLARDNPVALADLDRYFFGEPENPCISRSDLMEKYIAFIERIYPRRCCDDCEVTSSRMVMDMEMETPFVHNRLYCSICEEFSHGDSTKTNVSIEGTDVPIQSNSSSDPAPTNTKRRKRHIQKYGNAKIVSGVVDSATQPVLGILYGQRGNNLFRREIHRLSRDMTVRNCGPAYILRKAMSAIPREIWGKPFALNDTATNYIPSR